MPLIPEAGGTERITSLVAKGLSALGHKCMGMLVFSVNDDTMTYDGQNVTDLYAFLHKNQVDIVINQIAYAKWLLEDFLLRGGARWHSDGGKIISCLHFDSKPASVLYYFKSKQHKALRDYVTIAKLSVFAPYYLCKQEKATGEIYNWVYDKSDWYVTLSQSHFPYFKKVTRRQEYRKLIAINNPLTFNDISDKSILNEKRRVVLVCSRMDEYQKRISLILKAWEIIQNKPEASGWTLKILGTGYDIDRYICYSVSHGLHNVKFEGQRDPEPYYREADIFLMTSIGIEGWGLTLTESLQRGVVPVVMNTCSVYSDIITHGYNGYLSEGDNLKEFTNHVLSLMSDLPTLRTIQLNALESANRFTLARTMEKWKAVI
ncbi:MAG: glycosyltransferase [Bacteroidaceae bacterium]|nr:glycosyltransferase [Bacteroidaceae bacterium]